MKAGLQQGHADGMCGLYAVLNFVAGHRDWRSEEPADAMRYVLDAVRAEGLLSPYHLTCGYEPHQLVAICNCLFANYRMPYRAHQLSEVKRSSKSESFYELTERVLNGGGSVIGGPVGWDHWRLITTQAGKKIVIDSANARKPTCSFDKRQPKYFDEQGVAILRFEWPKVEVRA